MPDILTISNIVHILKSRRTDIPNIGRRKRISGPIVALICKVSGVDIISVQININYHYWSRKDWRLAGPAQMLFCQTGTEHAVQFNFLEGEDAKMAKVKLLISQNSAISALRTL